MKKFILASNSPRRKELLEGVGFDFQVIASDADESICEEKAPNELVMSLATLKAKSVFKNHTDSVVLGCDTVVEYNGTVLGKPKDRHDARRMLTLLSGRVHNVHTGVCIMDKNETVTFVSTVSVEFYELSQALIDSYLATGEGDDKAGAYGIQGLGSLLVRKISGDYFSVVGLPLAECARALNRFGITAEKTGIRTD